MVKEKRDIIMLIQVAWTMPAKGTRNREESSLIRVMNELNVNKGFVFTEDVEQIIEKDGKTI